MYYDILSKFDEKIICNQAITIETPASIYFQIARLLFEGRKDIGNDKYRGYIADKHFKKLIKTFIMGKMSIECYYYCKACQCSVDKAMDYNGTQKQLIKNNNNNNNSNDNDNNISKRIEYDITQLTRKRDADDIISPVMKNTSLYWNKAAWEHLNNSSQSCSIVRAFIENISKINKASDYFERLALEMIDIWPKYALIRRDLARHYYRVSQRVRTFDVLEKAVIDIPNNNYILSDIIFFIVKV